MHVLDNRAVLTAALGPIGDSVRWVLDCCAVAEELLTGRDVPGAFGILRPTQILVHSVDVYRAHARELCGRLAAGVDTRPGTDAEILCGMLGASSMAPLTAEGLAVVDHLWARVLDRPLPGGMDFARESWPGQVAEAIGAARRTMRQDWRRIPV